VICLALIKPHGCSSCAVPFRPHNLTALVFLAKFYSLTSQLEVPESMSRLSTKVPTWQSVCGNPNIGISATLAVPTTPKRYRAFSFRSLASIITILQTLSQDHVPGPFSRYFNVMTPSSALRFLRTSRLPPGKSTFTIFCGG